MPSSYLKPELMGKITMIHGHMYRNTPHGKPQWTQPLYPDMTAENIDWKAFLGEAPDRPFDANRYANWRFFWDYSGGNVYENMCHQLSFWYKVMGLQIPKSATMTGGLYLWKDGREVPDTMSVSMEHRGPAVHLGFGIRQRAAGGDGRSAGGRRHDHADACRASATCRRRKTGRRGTKCWAMTKADPRRPHAEFSGRDSRCGHAAELPVRAGLPRIDCVPHGGGQLPPGRTMHWDAVKEEIV